MRAKPLKASDCRRRVKFQRGAGSDLAASAIAVIEPPPARAGLLSPRKFPPFRPVPRRSIGQMDCRLSSSRAHPTIEIKHFLCNID
jgi:hypothetical protein